MENEINDRILIYIKHIGMNKNSFSLKLGHTNSTIINNIVQGRRNKPSYEVIFKILTTFENINAEWLITGRGEMLKEPDKLEEIHHVQEPRTMYSTKCSECERKQEVIDMQRQRIETFNQLIDSKNELIELLKGENKGNGSRACG